MNSLNILRKHISPGKKINLLNNDGSCDVIELNPITNAQRVLIFSIAKRLKIKEDDLTIEEIVNNERKLSSEFVGLWKSLIQDAFEDDLNEKEVEYFIVNNQKILLESTFSLVPESKDFKKSKKLEEDVEKRISNLKENESNKSIKK